LDWDVTAVGRRAQALADDLQTKAGEALTGAEHAVAQTASRSWSDVDAALARAQEVAGQLSDRYSPVPGVPASPIPLAIGIARKELPKVAATAHQDFEQGGVGRVVDHARSFVHQVNVGSGQVVKPMVEQVLTPPRESGHALNAALYGQWKTAGEHELRAVAADAAVVAPPQAAFVRAAEDAHDKGAGLVGSIAAGTRAGNSAGVDVVNGMNPFYLFPVAGEDGHQAVRSLLLDRDPEGFGRNATSGVVHGGQAIGATLGAADAAVLPGRLGASALDALETRFNTSAVGPPRIVLSDAPGAVRVVGDADAAYAVDADGAPVLARGELEGSHPGRPKGYMPEPIGGRLPGDHRGHLIAEGTARDPAKVNIKPNCIAEAQHSNLSPKKRFESLAADIKRENPGRVVETQHAPVRLSGTIRPVAVRHSVLIDGVEVHAETIENK
jgi:hypothetical protein